MHELIAVDSDYIDCYLSSMHKNKTNETERDKHVKCNSETISTNIR